MCLIGRDRLSLDDKLPAAGWIWLLAVRQRIRAAIGGTQKPVRDNVPHCSPPPTVDVNMRMLLGRL